MPEAGFRLGGMHLHLSKTFKGVQGWATLEFALHGFLVRFSHYILPLFDTPAEPLGEANGRASCASGWCQFFAKVMMSGSSYSGHAPK